MKKIGALTVLMLAGGGILGLAGCGSSTSTTASASPLVVLPSPIGSYTKNFNPFSPTVLPGTNGLIYESLFYFNPLKTQTYPILGKKFTWSNGNKTLTVDLRKNVQWTNGQAFTANDVVFTFDLLKKHASLDTKSVWSVLSAVHKLGNDKVVFSFKKPSVAFEWYILGQTPIVNASSWKNVKNPSKYSNAHPVGTGPYKLSGFSPQNYTFSPNTSYWQGTPKVSKVDFPAYTSNSSADLALARGKIAWGGLFMPNAQKIFVKPNPKTNHYWFPPNYIVTLYTNLKNPLLSQLPVRKAISLAINRKKIDTTGEYGYEKPSSPTGLVLPNSNAWLNPKLPQKDVSFSYSPRKAVQVLKNAGYKKDSQGVFVSPNGKPLKFTLNVVSSATDWVADASIMQRELKRVGISLTVNQEQYGAFYGALKSGTYQLSIWGSSPGPTPYYIYQGMLSRNSSGNYEHWNSVTTNKALSQYSTSSQLSVQKAAMYKIEQIMAQELPSIPLVNGPNWYEYNTKNFSGWPSPSNRYANPTPASSFGLEVVMMHLKPVK